LTARFLRINAVTRADRHRTIPALRDAVAESGGWITDFHLFSNASVCINFELPLRHAARLGDSLKRLDLRLTAESVEALNALGGRAARPEALDADEEIPGTLQVTFVHNEPDLRIEVPPIPG
jgi:hypothetical protein